MPLSKKDLKWILPIGIIFLIIAYLGEPSNGPIVPCLFNKTTGLYCPGCGMTRAINSVMHFKLGQALRFNFLIIILPPLMGIYLFLYYKKFDKWAKIITYLMLIITISYGLVRNFSIFNYL